MPHIEQKDSMNREREEGELCVYALDGKVARGRNGNNLSRIDSFNRIASCTL